MMWRATDWGFTDDGDLALGAPKVNDNGETLFLHPDGTVSTEGVDDAVYVRDIPLKRNQQELEQIIINRLRTEAPDWFHYPNMGGNLSDLIGESNTRATGDMGVQRIREALTYRGLMNEEHIHVRPVPIAPYEILFVITISDSNGRTMSRIPLTFNLQHGIQGVKNDGDNT